MRKVIAAVAIAIPMLLAMTGRANAAPVRYDLVFTLGPGDWGSVSGSFFYDAEAPLFTDFLVTWGPQSFDFTASANTASIPLGVAGCTDGPSCAFAVLSDASPETHENTWSALQTTHAYRFTFFQNFLDSGETVSILSEGTYDSPQMGNSTNTGFGTWSLVPSISTPGQDDISATSGPTSVPEPGTLRLLLISALGLASSVVRRCVRKSEPTAVPA